MKKVFIWFISVIGAASLLAAAVVVALNSYYCYYGVFPARVWINGIYCTGMTPKEVSAMLQDSYDLDSDKMRVRTMDGRIHELSLSEFDVHVAYDNMVKNCLINETNHFTWLENLRTPRIYQILPAYCYDVDVMKTKLGELDWLNERLYDAQNTISIVRSETDGYILVDKTKDLLLKENAVELICDEIVNQLTYVGNPFHDIDLSDDTNRQICYQSIPHTPEMKDTLAKWEGISAFQAFHMTYQFGDREEVIDKNVVADWMALDDNGSIIFDEENHPVLDETMIEEYVAYLSLTYNTVGKERMFQTTRGDVVEVASGSYGNAIDEKAEAAFLRNAFLNKESGVRIPHYISEAKEKGVDDIGDTYIEIDMGNQHMYYYVDGNIVIDTPVVTGNVSRGWDTPAKVCFVYFKQRNRVLRGANYATPVKYWMAVYGNIGIHDATWRGEFGGDIYKTDGSHGCINTPLEIMTELYGLVETGTPVIMFY